MTVNARPIHAVLGTALDELRERKRRLEPFIAELQEINKAIVVLERALGQRTGRNATRTEGINNAPSGETRDRVLKAIADSPEPLTTAQVAEKIGRENAGWLAMLLKKQVSTGALIEVEGGYGLPVAGSRNDD